MVSPAARSLLEQYAARDPNTQGYLQLYDLLGQCTSNPKACAEQQAKQQIALYLSSQTGIPAGDLLACFNDPNACAQNTIVNSAADAAGVSPEVIWLAVGCARSGDSDQCARAGLILAATAACAAYTSGIGTPVCNKVAPVLVNYAWPHIRNIINVATFGAGLDGLVSILTLGQGLSAILAPLGGVAKLLGGQPKGKFSDFNKHMVFHRLVAFTNDQVNAAIRGLWDGLLATRQAQGLAAPTGDQSAMQWAAGRWASHYAASQALQQRVADTADIRSGDNVWTAMAAKENAQLDWDWFNCNLPAYPVPSPSQVTPQLAAREAFIQAFFDELRNRGFNDSARRSSEKGKVVKLKGGSWNAYGWESMCNECTQNDVEVFADIATKLFAGSRVVHIEPVILHFVDVFARDIANDLKAKSAITMVPIATPALVLPTNLKPQQTPTVVVDISQLTKGTQFDPGMRQKFSSTEKTWATSISDALRAATSGDPLSRAWKWAQANPEYSIPAAAAVLGLVGVAICAALRTGFTPNAESWLKCQWCGSEGIPVGWDDEYNEPEYLCEHCGSRVRQSIKGTFFDKKRRHIRSWKIGPEDSCVLVRRAGGPDVVIHKPGCRPSRPLCKWMREVQQQKYGTCSCEMYPFKHRVGSGRCKGTEVPGLGTLRIPYPMSVDEYLGESGRQAQALALSPREPGDEWGDEELAPYVGYEDADEPIPF